MLDGKTRVSSLVNSFTTSSAILMPKPALREAFKNYFKFYGEKPRRLIRGTSPLENCYAQQLPEYIAGVFNVSKRAALIRLEKLTAIVNKGWRQNLKTSPFLCPCVRHIAY